MSEMKMYLLVIVLYCLPTIVALFRHAKLAGPVAVVNLLLGWTLIGWVVALAMAAGSVNPVTRYNGLDWIIDPIKRYVDDRSAARADLVARADEQHNLAVQGDPKGTYGQYPPADTPTAPQAQYIAEVMARVAEQRRGR